MRRPAERVIPRAKAVARIRDDNPVLVFEHKALYGRKGSLPSFDEVGAIGRAEVLRSGNDVTVVAAQLVCERALEAADRLAADQIDVEVIDIRTLVPLDIETIANSVGKTRRLVCVQECPLGGSWGASLIAALVTEAFAQAAASA